MHGVYILFFVYNIVFRKMKDYLEINNYSYSQNIIRTKTVCEIKYIIFNVTKHVNEA